MEHLMSQSLQSTLNQHYREEGYAVTREALPSALMDEAGRQLATLITGLAPGQRPEGLVEPHGRGPDWQFWLELCRTAAVVETVAECLGSDEVILIMSHLIVKPAGDGLAIAWHQDNTYWPSVHGTDVVTVWLALDDVDQENACMNVIPRTHAGYPVMEKLATDGTDLLKVRVAVDADMEASAIPVILRRGEYSLHDSFVIHGSECNRSTRRRAGYTMRYADAATVTIDLERHWNPVYYVRGNGASFKPGMIDIRPGHALPATPGGKPENIPLK